MWLDELIPRPDFSEFHARAVQAPAEHVWHAFTSLPVADLRVTRLLLTAHEGAGRFAGRAPRPTEATFLDASPVPLVVEEPCRYALAAGIGRPWMVGESPPPRMRVEDIRDFAFPGWVKVATDFSFDEVGGRTIVGTETRVVATDPESRRRMAAYWTGIRVFSGLIRREVLRAIDIRSSTRVGRRPAGHGTAIAPRDAPDDARMP
jgi:hypothetical protein